MIVKLPNAKVVTFEYEQTILGIYNFGSILNKIGSVEKELAEQ